MADTTTAVTRSVDTTIEINAPIDAVWRALTVADELTNWFPMEARITPGEGGSVWCSWGEGQSFETPIEVWKENEHLRLVYAEPDSSTEGVIIPARLLLDYYLEARGGSTVLRVVNSGFSTDAGWDDQYDGTERGWAFELRGLRHYLEHHPGSRRVVVHAMHGLDVAEFDDAWRALMGRDGLNASSIEQIRAGDRYQLTWPGGVAVEGVAHIIGPPRDLCGTVETLNDAFLRIRFDRSCFTNTGNEVNLWLSAYGLPRAQTDQLQADAKALLERLYGQASS